MCVSFRSWISELAGPIQFIFGTPMDLYGEQLPHYSEFENFHFWRNNSVFCDFGLRIICRGSGIRRVVSHIRVCRSSNSLAHYWKRKSWGLWKSKRIFDIFIINRFIAVLSRFFILDLEILSFSGAVSQKCLDRFNSYLVHRWTYIRSSSPTNQNSKIFIFGEIIAFFVI